MPQNAERQGFGNPATRAAIIEKLVHMGFAEHNGKQLLLTKDGHNLVSILLDMLSLRYSQISEDAQKLFQAERVVIGKCPRCSGAVYEGKKNYYYGNRACQFVIRESPK